MKYLRSAPAFSSYVRVSSRACAFPNGRGCVKRTSLPKPSVKPRAKPSIARGRACYVGRRASWTPVEYQRGAAATPPSSPPAHSLHSREREREDGEEEGGLQEIAR